MERYIENREARRPDRYTRAEEVVKVVLAAALKLSVCGAAGMVVPVLCGAPFTPALWLSGFRGLSSLSRERKSVAEGRLSFAAQEKISHHYCTAKGRFLSIALLP